MKNVVYILFLLIFVSSCASSSYSPSGMVNTANIAPKSPNYIVPIISIHGPQPDPNNYILIGMVEATKDAVTIFDKVKLNDLMNMLRSEARKAGADALIKVYWQRGRSTGRPVDSMSAYGSAIIFKDKNEGLKRLRQMGAIFR